MQWINQSINRWVQYNADWLTRRVVELVKKGKKNRYWLATRMYSADLHIRINQSAQSIHFQYNVMRPVFERQVWETRVEFTFHGITIITSQGCDFVYVGKSPKDIESIQFFNQSINRSINQYAQPDSGRSHCAANMLSYSCHVHCNLSFHVDRGGSRERVSIEWIND